MQLKLMTCIYTCMRVHVCTVVKCDIKFMIMMVMKQPSCMDVEYTSHAIAQIAWCKSSECSGRGWGVPLRGIHVI